MATLCLRCDKGSGLTNAEMDCNLSSLNTELGTTLKTDTSFGGDVSGCYNNITVGTVACATNASSAINSDCLGGATANCYARVDAPANFAGTQASGCGPHHFTGADVKLSGCCVNICGECCYTPYGGGSVCCRLVDHKLTFGIGADVYDYLEASGAEIKLGAATVPYSNPARYYGDWTFEFPGNMGFGASRCGPFCNSGSVFVDRWPIEINSTAPYGYGLHRVEFFFNCASCCGYNTLHAPSLACSNCFGVEMPACAIVCSCLCVDGSSRSCTHYSSCWMCTPTLYSGYGCWDGRLLKVTSNDLTLCGGLGVHLDAATAVYCFCKNTHPSVTGCVDFGPNLAKINNYCLPASDGSAGQFICTDGSGNLAFAAVSGGSGGGSSLTVQDEGSSLSCDATAINFVGKNITASGTGSTKTVCAHGDTVCITSGCFYSANTVSFALSDGWQSAELMFQADCRLPLCYYPSEPRLDALQLRRYCNYLTVFDYAASTTNNYSGCRLFNNQSDIFPDVYIADETILRYNFWRVPVGTNNTCSRIYFEASYVGGCHAYASTARCDRVFLSGRSDTVIGQTDDTGWCIFLCAGAHYITQGSTYCYCNSYMRCAEWALKVIT